MGVEDEIVPDVHLLLAAVTGDADDADDMHVGGLHTRCQGRMTMMVVRKVVGVFFTFTFFLDASFCFHRSGYSKHLAPILDVPAIGTQTPPVTRLRQMLVQILL